MYEMIVELPDDPTPQHVLLGMDQEQKFLYKMLYWIQGVPTRKSGNIPFSQGQPPVVALHWAATGGRPYKKTHPFPLLLNGYG